MKKICFLIGNLNNTGGTERVTSIVANALSNECYDISILSLYEGSNPQFLLDSDISIHSLNSKKLSFKKNYVSTVIKIRSFVKANKIETLIVVDSNSCLFTIPALYRLNIKHICWEHFNFKNNNDVKSRDIARKLAAKYCNYIVTLTQKDKELWQKGLNNIKAEIISIANPSIFKRTNNEPNLEFKVILAIGRLNRVKGFDLLIKAWAKVCKNNNQWILRIIGSGEEEKKLKSLANSLGVSDRIDFIEETRNVINYYQTSSFYCLSSRFEGLPMVLLEAQACGLPIIAFDCDTGPSEIVNHNVNGWLVPVQNVEMLSNAILEATSIPGSRYKKLVENSYINSKRFTIDEIILKWKKII